MTTDTALALLAEAKKWIQPIDCVYGSKRATEHESLLKRITALLDSGGWIGVDASLPDGWFIGVHSKQGTPMLLKHGDNLHSWQNITHWQPLPPLPSG